MVSLCWFHRREKAHRESVSKKYDSQRAAYVDKHQGDSKDNNEENQEEFIDV